jgi:2-methylcitrate dehydratase PrpD
VGRRNPCFRSESRLTYLQQLARFAHDARLADLPEPVLARARWVIADSLPVIAAGMQEPEMKAFTKSHLSTVSAGKSSLIGTGQRVQAKDAALLNGTAGTWLELNEGNLFAKGHPGIQVAPAAVALGQEMNASGEAVLMALAVGYEVCSRISRAAKVRIEVHPHGTWGVIGAAFVAGRLKGFDEKQFLTLLNVASTMGMATSRQTLLDGATVRNIFTGHSGYMGLMAAELVECGFTGEKDGPAAVFGKVLSDGFDPALAVKDLGKEWLLSQGFFKLHPTGRYVHSAIDALEDVLSRHSVDVNQIIKIHVTAYRLCAMLAETRVTSSFGARFSVPFALATILHHGRSGLEPFEDAAVANEAIHALAAKVEMKEEPAFTARYPAEQICELRVVLNDGTTLQGQCSVTKGEPSKPHSAAELEAKFIQLAVPRWGDKTARRLLEGCMRIEALPDFGKFCGDFEL